MLIYLILAFICGVYGHKYAKKAAVLYRYSQTIMNMHNDNQVLLKQLEAAHSTITELEQSLMHTKQQFLDLGAFADEMMLWDEIEPDEEDGWEEVTDDL